MKVLVACEYSGVVRDAFIKAGHDAISCDLLPTDSPGPHYQGDIKDALDWETGGFFDFLEYRRWDLVIAHPPCIYLCSSGLHWNKRRPGREEKTEDALNFVSFLWGIDCDKVCIENPVGCINSRLPFMPKPQYIQPYEYGHDASKKTGLWARGLPRLEPTCMIPPRIINGKERWGNQTDSGQNNLAPSADRWKIRSTTYQGIADAMASQWGNL